MVTDTVVSQYQCFSWVCKWWTSWGRGKDTVSGENQIDKLQTWWRARCRTCARSAPPWARRLRIRYGNQGRYDSILYGSRGVTVAISWCGSLIVQTFEGFPQDGNTCCLCSKTHLRHLCFATFTSSLMGAVYNAYSFRIDWIKYCYVIYVSSLLWLHPRRRYFNRFAFLHLFFSANIQQITYRMWVSSRLLPL